MSDDTNKNESFLDENQMEGKLSEKNKIEIKSLEEAINSISKIMIDDAVDFFKKTKEEEWPTCKMSIYCHDCRDIVPAGIGHTKRGNPRTICGTCKSKKISIGKEEALKKYYHLDKREKTPKLSNDTP